MPSTQDRPIYYSFVIKGSFAKETGASGALKMIAPLPASETTDDPLKFVAVTLAKTLEPQARLNGLAFKS